MPDWLYEVERALDLLPQTVRIFFRDDDAGWANESLFVLLDAFSREQMPLDLAVIPQALDRTLAEELKSRYRHQEGRMMGLHQHGYYHANHENTGRKCEFGGSRSQNQQCHDILAGWNCLQARLGSALDPIFTPPWNRCNEDTVAVLESLQFQALSRDAKASPLASSFLQQIPVHVDWSRIRHTSPEPWRDLGRVIIEQFVDNELTGIMLHHAVMDDDDLLVLSELLPMLSSHRNVQGVLLKELLKERKESSCELP